MYRSLLGDFESPKAEAFYVDVLRRLTPEQKCEIAIGLWEMAVETTRGYLRVQHPDWTEAQVQAVVARRILEANGGAARLPASSD